MLFLSRVGEVISVLSPLEKRCAGVAMLRPVLCGTDRTACPCGAAAPTSTAVVDQLVAHVKAVAR